MKTPMDTLIDDEATHVREMLTQDEIDAMRDNPASIKAKKARRKVLNIVVSDASIWRDVQQEMRKTNIYTNNGLLQSLDQLVLQDSFVEAMETANRVQKDEICPRDRSNLRQRKVSRFTRIIRSGFRRSSTPLRSSASEPKISSFPSEDGVTISDVSSFNLSCRSIRTSRKVKSVPRQLSHPYLMPKSGSSENLRSFLVRDTSDIGTHSEIYANEWRPRRDCSVHDTHSDEQSVDESLDEIIEAQNSRDLLEGFPPRKLVCNSVISSPEDRVTLRLNKSVEEEFSNIRAESPTGKPVCEDSVAKNQTSRTVEKEKYEDKASKCSNSHPENMEIISKESESLVANGQNLEDFDCISCEDVDDDQVVDPMLTEEVDDLQTGMMIDEPSMCEEFYDSEDEVSIKTMSRKEKMELYSSCLKRSAALIFENFNDSAQECAVASKVRSRTGKGGSMRPFPQAA